MGRMRRTWSIGAALCSILWPTIAAAQWIPESGAIGTCNFKTGELHFDCIPTYIAYLIQFMFAGVGMFALLVTIWAGYDIALAGATGQDKSAGYQRLRNAIIGLLVAVLAYAIIDFVIGTVSGS